MIIDSVYVDIYVWHWWVVCRGKNPILYTHSTEDAYIDRVGNFDRERMYINPNQRISSHFVSFYFTLFHVISSRFISFHLVSFHFISSHLIPYHLVMSATISKIVYLSKFSHLHEYLRTYVWIRNGSLPPDFVAYAMQCTQALQLTHSLTRSISDVIGILTRQNQFRLERHGVEWSGVELGEQNLWRNDSETGDWSSSGEDFVQESCE